MFNKKVYKYAICLIDFITKIIKFYNFEPQLEAITKQKEAKMDLKNYKGVLHGDQVQEMFEAAKKHQFALTCR